MNVWRKLFRHATKVNNRKLHILIFSKDRALQLESLLRSIADHLRINFDKITVLYSVSGSQFEDGYRELITQCPVGNCEWLKEICFENDLSGFLNRLAPQDLIMFLVDDAILFRPLANINLIESFTRRHLFISLRCSREYPERQPFRFSRLDSVLEWQWNFGSDEVVTWNYPFSLDGNIFHVDVIRKAIRTIKFRAPNSLEAQLHRIRGKFWVRRFRWALGSTESVLINNPLNRVQSEWTTVHADIPVAKLNEYFISGYRLDNAKIYDSSPSACHEMIPVKLVKHGTSRHLTI